MSAVSEGTKDLVTSPTNSESPKSPIPPSHEGDMPGQVSCDVTKQTTFEDKTKTKKRKIGDKKKEGPEKKEKTPRKAELKQTDQEKETRIKPAKKPAKMRVTNKCKTQDSKGQVKKMAGLETSLGEENSRDQHVSEKTVTEDVQIPETAPVQPSSTASSSLQFKDMPKLIKASFKPPSKKSSDTNTSCPKPMKMPKLWKPQFVCPAVAAAEKANNLLKGNKKEQSVQSKQTQVEVKRSVCDIQERCPIPYKRPSLQIKAVHNDPGLSGKN